MRCLALAQELQRLGAHTQFVCRQITPALEQKIQESGQSLIVLPSKGANAGYLTHSQWLPASQQEDASDTLNALGGDALEWLVVDHYALDSRWESTLRRAGARLFVLDDLADRNHDCNALLDQNLTFPASNRYRGLVPPECRLLLGCEFALLRPDFREVRNMPPVSRTPRVNVFFGGTDPDGMTVIALNAIMDIPDRDFAIDVIVGKDNPRLEELKNRCQEIDNLVLHIQPSNIASLFSQATLALGAGGSSTWERCCVGLPSLIVTIAGNQVSGAMALARERAAIYLGPMGRIEPAKLALMLRRLMDRPRLLAAMRKRAFRLVDGRGAERAAIYLMRDSMVLDVPTPEDAGVAWTWRNHPSTREFIHNPAPIPRAAHHEWWESSLKSPTRTLLLARCGPQEVGVLRFDYKDKEATVSIYLDPELAGIGLGNAMLRAGNQWLQNFRPDIEVQRAEVLPENKHSQRCFMKAGYYQSDGKTWKKRVEDVRKT